jgi:spore maturation protein CgeB
MPRARRAGIDGLLSRPLARLAAARSGSPDAVLVVRGRFLRSHDVELLREATGAPVVNYYPDNPLHGRLREAVFLRALATYDLVAVWCSSLADELAAIGVRRRVVVPFGYDPVLYAPPPAGTVPDFDVAFVGSASPNRLRWLRELDGLRVAVAGHRWRRLARGTPLAAGVLAGPHWGRDAARVYWSAHVGVNLVDPQNLIGHNMRTWELPATGRPSVMTRTPDHEALFSTGGAVLVDRPTELRPAVEQLLADPRERMRIGRAGAAAIRHGTWRLRARELAAAIAPLAAG